MAFATTAVAVIAGIYVYNEFIVKEEEVVEFGGRRRRR